MVNDWRRRAFVPILMAGLFLNASACTTAIVNAGREDAGDPLRELSDMAHALEGLDVGNTEYQGAAYRRILIPSARHACNSARPVELLLPVGAVNGTHAVLREGTDAAPGAAPPIRVYDSIRAKPPVTAHAGAHEQRHNDAILAWLANQPNPADDPVAVVFGYDESGSELVVMYKLDASPTGVRTVEVRSDLGWVCRSRLRYGLLVGAYPVAVAVDIVTLPVQAILLLLSAH